MREMSVKEALACDCPFKMEAFLSGGTATIQPLLQCRAGNCAAWVFTQGKPEQQTYAEHRPPTENMMSFSREPPSRPRSLPETWTFEETRPGRYAWVEPREAADLRRSGRCSRIP